MKFEAGDRVVFTEHARTLQHFFKDKVWTVTGSTSTGVYYYIKCWIENIHCVEACVGAYEIQLAQEDRTLDEASLRVENDRLRKSRDEYKEAFEDVSEDNERLLDENNQEAERSEEMLRDIYRALYSAEPEDSKLIWNALREEIGVTKKNEKEFMELYKRQSERADQVEQDRDEWKKAFGDLFEDDEFRSQLGETQVEIADLRCALGHWKEAARLAEQELDERDKQVDKLKDELRNKQLERYTRESQLMEEVRQAEAELERIREVSGKRYSAWIQEGNEREGWKSRALEAEQRVDDLEENSRRL